MPLKRLRKMGSYLYNGSSKRDVSIAYSFLPTSMAFTTKHRQANRWIQSSNIFCAAASLYSVL